MHNGKQNNELDKALEDTFPASDPVAISQPDRRQGEPRRYDDSSAAPEQDDEEDDEQETVPEKVRHALRKVEPDYLWIGGAFVLGCVVGLAARSLPAPRRDPTARLQRKLSQLIERLQ